jgi:hypothetical protein
MATQQKKNTTKAKRSRKKGTVSTTAFHAQSKDGSEHFVGIGNLRVMLLNDEGSWFAQGLEIDYCAQGDSVEDVQIRFHDGLLAMVDCHLKVFGSIDGVLKVAPPETWSEFYGVSPLTKRYFQLSFHIDEAERLPFSGIEYYEKTA